MSNTIQEVGKQMPKPISDEKRADIVRHMEAGRSRADVAEWLFVCVHTVARVWNKYRRTGSCSPEPRNSGRKPLVSDETMALVAARIKEAPDATLQELIDGLGLPISRAALSRRLIGMGFTYKKKRSTRPAATGRTSPKRGRRGLRARTG